LTISVLALISRKLIQNYRFILSIICTSRMLHLYEDSPNNEDRKYDCILDR
jgi:hypothetical protein